MNWRGIIEANIEHIQAIYDDNGDIYTDNAMDVQPKPKSKAKPAEKPICPRPITKNSQRETKMPNVAYQRIRKFSAFSCGCT